MERDWVGSGRTRMADALQMDEKEKRELKEMINPSFWVMRIIGYPPLPKGAEGISCGAHKGTFALSLFRDRKSVV